MAEPAPVRPSEPISSAAPAEPRAAERAHSAGAAVSFQALLDDLAARAQDLSIESRRELSRAELSDAVEDARETLERALALQARLLASYREAQQRAQIERAAE
jgi:hypothetical protein